MPLTCPELVYLQVNSVRKCPCLNQGAELQGGGVEAGHRQSTQRRWCAACLEVHWGGPVSWVGWSLALHLIFPLPELTKDVIFISFLTM